MNSSTCREVALCIYDMGWLEDVHQTHADRICSASAPIVATLLHNQIQPCQAVFMLHQNYWLIQVVGQHVTAGTEKKEKNTGIIS